MRQANLNKYVSTINEKTVVYKDEHLTQISNVTLPQYQTYFAKESYVDDTTRKEAVSLFNGEDKLVGYVNKEDLKIADGPQGVYIHNGNYLTINRKTGQTYSDFEGKAKHSFASLYQKTYRAKGQYNHINGSVFYSLYNDKNEWMGYVPESDVSLVNSPWGEAVKTNKYVSIAKGNYDLWRSFNWVSNGKASRYNHKTFIVKEEYHHFNTSTYAALTDSTGTFYGYINDDALKTVSDPQGEYYHYGKYVTISSSSTNLWRDFNWNVKQPASKIVNQTFQARGIYYHVNGEAYFSVYDNKGVWQGYLNANATSLTAEKMKKVQKLLDNKYRTPNMGIYVMSLVDGSTASVNGSQSFVAASTGKLPAMYYSQKMINDKRIDPNKKYKYTDAINQMPYYSYQRDGAGILQGKPYGTSYSIDTMMNWTAKYSDNQGANFLGYYAGRQYDAEMRRDISKIIGRTWVSPFNITAKENALLMEAIYKQNGKLINYMSNTQFDNQRIPKYLPVKVAHKIGDVNSYVHDVAIVYAKEPYVLSVMTKNGISYETISKLSKEVYDILK
ncbi:serine hydrolase [Vagococcus jeotgali]|uniref:serine hydrolase n=1 Tax=Vagococcus jeotgali TaxID=3109030 RepID=UPI002DDB55F3|nr:serine hydrolase [Vagococcus sp. B2T-5]